MSKRIQTVGMIGSGPSGATLAALLAMRGVEVTIFDDGRRPDLIVGESLIPTIVPVLAEAGRHRRRVTDVATYTNYQLVSDRGHGPGWVMSGDAFGFVDPMLSPGMWLALHSAELLSERLDDLAGYEREMRAEFRSWMQLIEYFYDGRMFALYHTGIHWERKYPGKISQFMHRYFDHTIACMASGATTRSRYGHGLLRFMAQPGMLDASPAELAIR